MFDTPGRNHRAEGFRCVAGILVGGQSRRMGRPKLALPLADGRALVEHVAEVALRAELWLDEVVILGFTRELPGSLASLRVLPDVETGAGPLAGLCALLQYSGQRWSLLLACDMPLLELSAITRLLAAVSPDSDAVAYARPDRPNAWHACCALYHPRILTAALRELKSGKSLQHLLASIRLTTIPPSPAEERALLNVNTPQEYEGLVCQG